MSDHYLTVLAAVVLLSALILNVNRSILLSSTDYYESEAIMTATSVGQQLLDEISSRAFDENTINNYVQDVSGFTGHDSLTFESGELYPNFDDVDDFNGYYRTDSTSRMGNFVSSVIVAYVNPASPDVIQNLKTRMKRISVVVSSPYLVGNLQLNYYSSY